MKTIFFALTMALSLQANARQQKAQWAQYSVNWFDKKTLFQSHLGMCDDSFYGGFTYRIPGEMNRDLKVKLQFDRDCKVDGIRTINLNGRLGTEINVKGQCNGSIEVEQLHDSHLKATLESADAC